MVGHRGHRAVRHAGKACRPVNDPVCFSIRTRHVIPVKALGIRRNYAKKNRVKVRATLDWNTRRLLSITIWCLVCQFGPFVPATTCSRTCGNGTQLVNRTCYNIATSNSSVPIRCSNASACGTSPNLTVACNTFPCTGKRQQYSVENI